MSRDVSGGRTVRDEEVSPGDRSGTWRLARSSAVAHASDLAGTGLVLAAAGAVVSLTGVLLETGLRAPASDAAPGMLTALASSYAGTALVVLLMVVTSTVALALGRRVRQLSLLRTVGATRSQVRAMVSLEVALLALVAVPLGAVPGTWGARLLVPLLVDAQVLAPGARLVLSPLPSLGALVLIVPVALLAGRLAVRRSLLGPPTTAVRLAVVEPDGIGRARKVAAVLLALGGLSVAGSPVLVPGTVGAASAAVSALLLVGAAAAAGPWLVHAAFSRLAPLSGAGPHASARLALGNVVGFSRRLTAVVVPLALVVAVGTMSASVDGAVERAAHQQLADALRADLVAVAPGGGTSQDLERLREDPAVADAVALGSAPVQVRVDADLSGPLAWETTAVAVVDPSRLGDVVDPGFTTGGAPDLAVPGTVALSADAAFELAAHVGDEVAVRVAGRDVDLRVAAVHDRGLGLGGLLVSPATAAAAGADVSTDVVLVRAARGATAGSVVEAVERTLGARVDVTPVDAWVDEAVSSDAASQRLSSVLLLALLGFVALGAGNAVALTTRNRRDELVLLGRTGATRRQRIAMVVIEASIAAAVAWALGTLSVLPAAIAVNLALLGATAPALPLATFGGLSAAIFVVALSAALVSVLQATRDGSRGPLRVGLPGR
ncbi:putative ABC transport system permease protein [Nocardioides cavernae]|uniref:Putative ABC transport system permease protein n=1 Tax=Nocardioides cavernae TaxID=1921566 RepID=A0A7Y9H5P1_9ACTN|nr:ABC transporter permease [Nocardioides cavernae]NYE38131.1 putative ABC transport system permease protein [Nocardioides cavernae]